MHKHFFWKVITKMMSMDGQICIIHTIPGYQDLAQDHFDKFVAITHLGVQL
jgi:hypothetical protein